MMVWSSVTHGLFAHSRAIVLWAPAQGARLSSMVPTVATYPRTKTAVLKPVIHTLAVLG
jgi:hypothetical protein